MSERKSGHDMIKNLRDRLGIPEEQTTQEEEDYERRYREARAKRVEEAGYIDRYVELFNRDYWTDKWLGPGPDPGLQYMEEPAKKANTSDAEFERKEWEDRYVPAKMPNFVLDTKEPKAVKKARKKRKQRELTEQRQQEYDLAYWFLEKYLKPAYSEELYLRFAGDVEGLVDYVCEYARSWFHYANRSTEKKSIQEVMKERASMDEVVLDVGGMKFRRLEVAERKRRHYDTCIYTNKSPEIPEEYWEEFKDWCKKHPLKKYRKKADKLGLGKKTGAIMLRRLAFLKKINKRNHGFHKNIMKSGLNMFDPVTGQSFVSEKKMKSYMEKRLKRYDRRRAEFVKMLDGMVKRGEISEDMAISWMGDTQEARDRVERRYKDMQKRIKDVKPSRFDTEHPKRYKKQRDDWFKKFGADPDIPPFTISFDGEETRVSNVAKRGRPPVWRFDRPLSGMTDYIEGRV